MAASRSRSRSPGRGDRGRDAATRRVDQALCQDWAAREGVRARLGRKTDRGAGKRRDNFRAPAETPACRVVTHGSLRIVLEDCEDVGNRAAILRTAEAFGLLHIHEIPGAELKTPNGRAKKIGVAHSGQKWLRISVHSSAAECVAALRAAGCESIWRRCRPRPRSRRASRGTRRACATAAAPRPRPTTRRARLPSTRSPPRRSSTSISAGTRRSALGTSASA